MTLKKNEPALPDFKSYYKDIVIQCPNQCKNI